MNKYFTFLLICLFISGCALNNSTKENINPPPEIKKVYYFDSKYGKYYESIESDIYLTNKDILSTNDLQNIREVRTQFFVLEGKNCEYVLAYYKNGKTIRVDELGSSICN